MYTLNTVIDIGIVCTRNIVINFVDIGLYIVPELLPELAWFATRVHQTIWTLKLKRNCPADDAAEVGVGGRDAEMQRCRDAVVLVFRAWCWAGLGWVRWWPVSGRADN